jgi:hypothetical protein
MLVTSCRYCASDRVRRIAWQVELIREQAAVPGIRVVVATHSLNLIDKVEIGNVVHLELAAAAPWFTD